MDNKNDFSDFDKSLCYRKLVEGISKTGVWFTTENFICLKTGFIKALNLIFTYMKKIKRKKIFKNDTEYSLPLNKAITEIFSCIVNVAMMLL